jgi:hypothetical protein
MLVPCPSGASTTCAKALSAGRQVAHVFYPLITSDIVIVEAEPSATIARLRARC